MDYYVILIPIVIFIVLVYCFVVDYKQYKKSVYYEITHNSYFSVKLNTGIRGEYSLYLYLQEFEKQGCKFLFNLYFPRENGKTSEIDIIMFHPKGLFVIESKNFSGWIFGNERNKQWTQTFLTGDKYHFYNPIMQNTTHIRSLRQIIDDTIPIYSVIAFSDCCTLKKVKASTDVIVNYYSAISSNIKFKLSQITTKPIRDDLLEDTYAKLLPFSQVSFDIKYKHIIDCK